MKTRLIAIKMLAVMLAVVVLASGATVRVKAGEGHIQDVTATPFGEFEGVEYVKYEGRFVGTTAAGDSYDAPFEIIAPADPERGNGRLLVESFHPVGGAIVRNEWLAPDFLFGRGFSHAAICSEPPGVPVHPCTGFLGTEEDQLEIIADFAAALKGSEAPEFLGDMEKLYSSGASASAGRLHFLLHSPLGQGLFDLSFPTTYGWDSETPHEPAEGVGYVMLFITESELVMTSAEALRNDPAHPTYRLYEVAGGPHIPDTPNTRIRFPGPPDSPLPPVAGSTPLDWTPVVRALFVAGDRWVTEGTEPPSSAFLMVAQEGEIDPVYGSETGIARDDNLNARGGIRLPDVGLGRGQFIAVDYSGFPLFGSFVDLQCEPLPDGSPRFRDHGAYVSQFAQETHRLVAAGFLLPEDADRMIQQAAESDVGKPHSCP